MISAGSILRKNRESQGRAIADIANQLCITQSYLLAIENDNIAGIPGLFFYKNFTKQYAAILGVSQESIRPALDAIREPDGPPRPEIRVPDHLVQASNRRHIPDISLAWSLAGLGLVLLACSGFYTWWKRAPQRDSSAVTIQHVVPAVAVLSAPIVPVGRPVALNAAPADEASGVVLNLSATEKTWLSINSGGKEIFAGILQPSESKTLTGLDRATMKVGNAGGIEVRLNGKPIGPLGPRGQVLTIRFTPQDFEIVPPKTAALTPYSLSSPNPQL